MGVPFPPDEYRGRAARVRDEMARRGVDVLYVTSPANLCYLTGFESIWYPPRAPLGVVVTPGETVFVDYERHRRLVEQTAFFDDAIFFTYETALATVADAFVSRGWAEAAVGIEWSSRSPSGPLLHLVAAALESRGASIVDADWLVDRVRLVKSPAEIERVRRASEIVDSAFLAIRDEARPGMTELEIAARLDALMAEQGGEQAAIRTMVSAGPDVWFKTHAAPSRRPLERGDVMYVDACGVVDRYHVDLCRTFSIGDDNPGARAILDTTAQSVVEVQRIVKAGDPLDVAQRVAEDFVYSRFRPDQVWWVGGYALGIALPPDWVGHTYLSNDAYEQFAWEPGYVTNYENILFDAERRFTASYMETLLMTERGIEILSSVPRELLLVEC